MKPRSIYVGGVIGRTVEVDHMLSMMQLVRHPAVERYQPKTNDALLCRARSQVASHFLEKSQAEVLLTIDSDIVFDVDAAIRVCESALTHDIVGGLYITRSKGKFCFPTSLLPEGERVWFGNDPTPVETKWIATGFVAVHRRVLEKMATRADCPVLHASNEVMRFRPFYTPFIAPHNGEDIYLSEDWAFCERARQEGFKTYIDPSVRLLHLGQYPFKLEDMLTQQPETQPLWLTRNHDGSYTRESETPPVSA